MRLVFGICLSFRCCLALSRNLTRRQLSSCCLRFLLVLSLLRLVSPLFFSCMFRLLSMYLTNSCSHCFWFLFIVSLSISCFFTLYFSLDARALDARALQQVCSNAHEHQLRLSVGIPRAACLTTSVEVVFHCHRCREALPSGGQDDVGYAKVLRLKVRRLLPVVVFIVPEYTW